MCAELGLPPMSVTSRWRDNPRLVLFAITFHFGFVKRPASHLSDALRQSRESLRSPMAESDHEAGARVLQQCGGMVWDRIFAEVR